MKSGYVYVLTHPSDPNLYKIGITIREPRQRLAEHNNGSSEFTGCLVKETGQKWELKEYISVPDPYWAESVFWGATRFADIPYRNGIEIERMDWEEIQRGLNAAKTAGVRPDLLLKSLPDHVYAYTASMRKRLEGRGIDLLGHVKSMVSGKSNFRCSNGHEWRARPMRVAEGEGCPFCGIGKREPDEIRKSIRAGVICLLTHPDKSGFVKIGIGYGTLEEICRENPWGVWTIDRHRNIDEVDLAEILLWDLLEHPLPHNREPIKIELTVAEAAFRKLIYALHEEIAFEEKRKEIYK